MNSFVYSLKSFNASSKLTFNILCILGGSLFLASLSQFSLHLWFTPVPITLQTLGVMLMSSALGSKKSFLAVLAYLMEGALGLPVFAEGGYGIATLIGPTGGYLFSFALGAYLMGYLMEKGCQKSFFLKLLTFLLGSSVILVMGATWLGFYVGANNAFALGIAPFLIGCVIKTLIASLTVTLGNNFLEKITHL